MSGIKRDEKQIQLKRRWLLGFAASKSERKRFKKSMFSEDRFMDPKPEISIFREASFGYGILEVVNATHALWSWHRNDDHDENAVLSDSFWFRSFSAEPACKV